MSANGETKKGLGDTPATTCFWKTQSASPHRLQKSEAVRYPAAGVLDGAREESLARAKTNKKEKASASVCAAAEPQVLQSPLRAAKLLQGPFESEDAAALDAAEVARGAGAAAFLPSLVTSLQRRWEAASA